MRPSLVFWVLTLSLAAFAVRAVIYGLVGAFFPLIFILAVMVILLAAYLVGRDARRVAVRGWGACLVVYGVLRLGLAALLAIAPISSPHALEHTGWVFVLVSTLYLAAGVCLVTVRRERMALVTAE